MHFENSERIIIAYWYYSETTIDADTLGTFPSVRLLEGVRLIKVYNNYEIFVNN